MTVTKLDDDITFENLEQGVNVHFTMTNEDEPDEPELPEISKEFKDEIEPELHEYINKSFDEIRPTFNEDLLNNKKVLKRILEKGDSNRRPTDQDIAVIHYSMYLENAFLETLNESSNSTSDDENDAEISKLAEEIPEMLKRNKVSKSFDTTMTNLKPLRYDMEFGGKFVGFHMAIDSMCLGEKSVFLVDQEYAYGKHGAYPDVPDNSDILFIIELTKLTAEKTATEALNYEPRERNEKFGFEKIIEMANYEKNEGNENFIKDEPKIAERHYKRGIQLVEELYTHSDEENHQRIQLLCEISLNIAKAAIELRNYKKACFFSEKHLILDKTNPEAYLRKGIALKNLETFDNLKDARDCLLKGMKLDPRNTEIGKELTEVDIKIQQQNKNHKNMCKNMLNLKENQCNKFKNIDKELLGKFEKKFQQIVDGDAKQVYLPLITQQSRLIAAELAAKNLELSFKKDDQGYRIWKKEF